MVLKKLYQLNAFNLLCVIITIYFRNCVGSLILCFHSKGHFLLFDKLYSRLLVAHIKHRLCVFCYYQIGSLTWSSDFFLPSLRWKGNFLLPSGIIHFIQVHVLPPSISSSISWELKTDSVSECAPSPLLNHCCSAATSDSLETCLILCLQVYNILYRVHKYYLEVSPV